MLQAKALRGVLLNGTCLVATAFDLSCWRLPEPLLSSLVTLVSELVTGEWVAGLASGWREW